nr:MAG TPA: hypothetical protein [Caudoviricetes sp.]
MVLKSTLTDNVRCAFLLEKIIIYSDGKIIKAIKK